MRKIASEELYKPENYIKPGTKLKINLKNKKDEKFLHQDKNFVTLLYWEDYYSEDDIDLVFKEKTYCHLRDVESIEILED